MSRKMQVVIASYTLAALIALGVYSGITGKQLRESRTAAQYSASLAFEETVTAVTRMEKDLSAVVYATDGSMCGRLCSRICANALAAEAALSTLPFSTQELEETSKFLNQVADYTGSLCATAAQDGFQKRDVEALAELSKVSKELRQFLQELQGKVHEGSVLFDTQKPGLINVGTDMSVGYIGEELLRMEKDFPRRSLLRYDGKYSEKGDDEKEKNLSDAEMLAVAARYAGASPGELKMLYEYEGENGQKCFQYGSLILCVDRQGVESFSQSRLISERRIHEKKAETIAESYLEKQGFTSIEQVKKYVQDGLACFLYAPVQDDILLEDRCLRIAVALDDGSIYAFNRGAYQEKEVEISWEINEDQARNALPDNLKETRCRRVVSESEGAQEYPCYRFECENSAGEIVQIYVDSETGRQRQIKT